MTELRTLVVEDSPTMLKLMASSLKRIAGMHVVEAEHGADAVRKLSAWKFDLIVTDINMPVMDGLTLVARIRAGVSHRETPIIVVTTEGAESDRERALLLGATEYLIKPLQAPVFLAKAKHLLGLE
ncbi:MAG: response regulator [Sandaracinaceae bacterium]|jgi:two-component system chemotaxis response regulator CheY|nr:response regulator [Sandaracinaceae bacterium]